jgi:hypothetical protein
MTTSNRTDGSDGYDWTKHIDADCPVDCAPIDALPMSDASREFLKSRGIRDVGLLENFPRELWTRAFRGLGEARAAEIEAALAAYKAARA